MDVDTQSSPHDDGLTDFVAVRGILFGIAYRMLRNPADAEDVVQETWLRWQRHDHAVVRDPAAFLATTARHVALNELTSARARHEASAPDALGIATDDDPSAQAERAEALAVGTRRLVERLTPAQRAAFVLRVGFGYPYAQIADLLDTSPAGARQLVSRARRDLLRSPTQPVEGGAAHRHLLRELVFAARTGDLNRLELLLQRDLGLATRDRRSGRRRVAAG
ncbi:sigma-70 family RNA polymerase sigma factor [Microbacterium protaetiae]|uniref:sigma-70 family RNA polymerase sigma factor n=1 Tax=Microbacterium protaetiae TaxID=2509458 RepID=UPI0013EB9962|nr:sigma-70 family RNA polymerase sigma factor [Microbacterium protaetiae]